MASKVEPMDVDGIDCEFDNKENAYQNNVFSTRVNIEKGYEELEVSEMNMRLRYSITPSSSPMSKSFTMVCNETKSYDKFDNNLNSTIVNDTNNLTQSWSSMSCPSGTKSNILKNVPTSAPLSIENFNSMSVKSNLTVTLSDNLMKNNETVTITSRDEAGESPYPSSSFSPLSNISVADASAKEIPKSLDSPIIRGLKSVFNIFRSSQSPILPSNTDEIPEIVEETHEINVLSLDDTGKDVKVNPILASTPICKSKSKDESKSKRNSPYKDSIVFNEDLVNELQWNNETTILFSNEKIPIHKLLLQQAHSSSPESDNTVANAVQSADILDKTIVLAEVITNSELTNISVNEQQLQNNTRSLSNVLPCYSNKKLSDSPVDHLEDDSEFLDCENTFTDNDLYSSSVNSSITLDKKYIVEDLNVAVKNKTTPEVTVRVVVPNAVESSVIIEKLLNDDEKTGKNEIPSQGSAPKNETYDIVKLQDEFKINNEELLPNLDMNDMKNSISNCKYVSSSDSKIMDKESIDWNSPIIELCCDSICQNNIQTLKAMALKIVHGMIEFEKEGLNNDLLKDDDVPNRDTVNDSLLKFKGNEDISSKEINDVNSVQIVQDTPLIDDSEKKDEKHLSKSSIINNKLNILIPQGKLGAMSLSQDMDCYNKNADTNSIQKEFSKVQIEEVSLFSENSSSYVSLKTEQGHTVEDAVITNLEYHHNSGVTTLDMGNSLHQHSVIQDFNVEDQLNHKTNEVMMVENTCSLFKQNQSLNSAMTSLVNTATEVVENTINKSIQVLEHINKKDKTLNVNTGVNVMSLKDTSEPNIDKRNIEIKKVSNSEGDLGFAIPESVYASEKIKVSIDSVAFDNCCKVGNENDVEVGALDSLVNAATEIVANVMNISIQYAETIDETEISQKPDFVLGTIKDAKVDVNDKVSLASNLSSEINVEVMSKSTLIDVAISSDNERKNGCVDKENENTVLKDEVGETKVVSLTPTIAPDLILIHDSFSKLITQNAKEGSFTDNIEVNSCTNNLDQTFDSKHDNGDCIITQGVKINDKENLFICSTNNDIENKNEVPIGALATLISNATDVVVNVISTAMQPIREVTQDTDLQNVGDKSVEDNKNISNEIGNANFSSKEENDNCTRQKMNIAAALINDEILESKNDNAHEQMNQNHNIGFKPNIQSQEKKTFMEVGTSSFTEQSAYISASTSSEKRQNIMASDFDNPNFTPFVTKSNIRQSSPIYDTTNVSDECNFNKSLSDYKLNNLHPPDLQVIEVLSEPITKIIEKSDIEIHQSIEEEQFNFHIDCDNSKESERTDVTIKELLTEEEDTVEGPFFDISSSIHPVEPNLLSEREEKGLLNNFTSEKFDLKQFTNLNQENDQNHESGEVFINADAFEFFMNQNGNTVVNETDKESLFLKFDPLCANKVDASGVVTILSKMQNSVSATHKYETLNDQLPGASASTFGDLNEDLLNASISRKPMMAVPPAVNSEASLIHNNRLSTPTRSPRQSIVSSPAIAIIDRLISISPNSSSFQGLNLLQDTHQPNESETILAQLKVALHAKEQDIQQLRIESGELRERLCNLESHMNKLEKDNEEKLRKINDLNETLAAKTKMNKNMAAVVEEYERTIAGLIAESEQEKKLHETERAALIRERDEQTAHLESMEVSFSDLHSKYEKSKQIILSYKTNEDKLRKSVADFEDTFKKMQNNYDLLKQHATSKLNTANQEFYKLNKAHEAELLKFNAMIKRKELHITSLEETLSQKIKANEELTAICDELINKVG